MFPVSKNMPYTPYQLSKEDIWHNNYSSNEILIYSHICFVLIIISIFQPKKKGNTKIGSHACYVLPQTYYSFLGIYFLKPFSLPWIMSRCLCIVLLCIGEFAILAVKPKVLKCRKCNNLYYLGSHGFKTLWLANSCKLQIVTMNMVIIVCS